MSDDDQISSEETDAPEDAGGPDRAGVVGRAGDWTGWGGSADPLPRGIGAGLDAWLSRQPAVLLWIETVLLVAVIAAVDFVTPQYSLSVFYLIPVIFATWFISRRAGAWTGILSAGAWLAIDFMTAVRPSPLIPVWNALVRLASYMIVMQLVHIMKVSRAHEAQLARTDSLTGVANGRAFSDRADLELASARRSGTPLTMAYIDLDNFKHVNDTMGHTEGDTVLQIVARALGSRARETDLVARLGGDEFGVLLPNTDAETAPGVLDALMVSVREAVDGSWNIGCTIGAMTFLLPPESVDFMVRAADELMYHGKRAGRGRIEHGVWPGPIRERSEAVTAAVC
jgi:diguanylate cyclase (GGDEF)-like protein